MVFSSFLAAAILSISFVACAPATRTNCTELPTIDLGYVKQQASGFNDTGNYYNFTNIAFAEPPLGTLRFAAPQPPKHIPSIQNGGSKAKSCPQATPPWLAGGALVPKAPTDSEDCLYLDVLVPKKIFEQRQKKSAPVLVWIYGGGYVLGSKTLSGGGAGLLARSMEQQEEGVVYVALNYRVGAFGFLGGKAFTEAGGTPNAGLLDQRLALEWVQENVRQFGGDPSRVTVMGESGGASSIGFHMTSGNPSMPFQQAILQSPATLPELPANSILDEQYFAFLKALNTTSLAQARQLDTNTLQSANRQIIQSAPQGTFAYGASIDQTYIHSTLAQGLRQRRFNPAIKLMTAYNSNEGALFLPTFDGNYTFPAYISSVLPQASTATISRIVNNLYPESQYPDAVARANAFIGDVWVYSNAYSLTKAFGGRPFAYEFSLPPGYHTQDLGYTFWNGASAGDFGPINATVAKDMQRYFTTFAMHGDPKGGVPSHGKVLNLTETGYEVVGDPLVGERYEFWANYGA